MVWWSFWHVDRELLITFRLYTKPCWATHVADKRLIWFWTFTVLVVQTRGSGCTARKLRHKMLLRSYDREGGPPAIAET